MQKALSFLEKKLLKHIAKHIDRHGYQPSYREIAEQWGYRSPGYITTLVSKLEKRGVVKAVGQRALAFDHHSYL